MSTPSRTADLSRVRSLCCRRPTGFAAPRLDEQDARFGVAQARYGLGGVLASLSGCRYVNHPHRIGDAEFKPSGLAAAARAGFAAVDGEQWTVRQGGPVRLWDGVEDQPPRRRTDGSASTHRFEVVITPGAQRITWPATAA